MNTKITCRFGSQEALDEFNKRNGFDFLFRSIATGFCFHKNVFKFFI